MKNLLTYVHPFRCFDFEHETLVKIQIDNSLDLGWDRQDIILATNFDYEYNGVRSVVVGDANRCRFKPTVAKINVILELFARGLIGAELHWFHDFDAYQQEVITEAEIGDTEMGLTDYGHIPQWSTGTIFFRETALDIFGCIRDISYEHLTIEERALWALTGHDTHREVGVDVLIKGYRSADTGIEHDRIRKLNITYNFQAASLAKAYDGAIKPLKVTHFHLIRKHVDFFLGGKNEIDTILVPERLVRIFRQHGIST